ncbi:Uracil DNA glycosylase superfamily protein [Candidatus Magnetomoraceae bacterium gMMP-15]
MEQIFKEWKEREIHKGKLFITDGIIDQEKWDISEIKILFLLKEAYESNPEVKTGWSLCNLISKNWKGPKGKMCWAMAQWAYGIQQLHKTGDVPFFQRRGDDLKRALLSSAVINLKKSEGKSKSDNKDLSSYVKSDWDLIERQIDLIKPNIVICGMTFPLIRDRLKGAKKFSEWIYIYKNLYFIDFWHPTNRYPNKLNYYSLCSVIRLSKLLTNIV